MNSGLPDLVCACANARRAARLVTQLYSQQLGSELEPTQFALLTALEQNPGCNRPTLGEALGLDKTSLSRSLSLIEKNGWVQAAKSEDRRERGYRLAPAGRRILAQSRPAWQRAQSKLREALGPAEWESMQKVLVRVAQAAHGTLSRI